MIPRCHPSNSKGSMIVGEVNPSGKRKWVDYIPVETVASATNKETYKDLGARAVEILASLTGKKAWVDYIPVVTTTGTNWSANDGGVIPVYEGDAWSAAVTAWPAPTIAFTEQKVLITIGEATDHTAIGYNSYDEGVNGVVGSPFGALSQHVINGILLREIDWGYSSTNTVMTIIVNSSVDPEFTRFTFIGFTHFDVSAADTPGGSSGSFDGEDIWQYTWTFPTALGNPPDVGSTYELVVE